jgi:hypothetical protein
LFPTSPPSHAFCLPGPFRLKLPSAEHQPLDYSDVRF